MMKFAAFVVAAAAVMPSGIAGPIKSRGYSGGDVTYYGGGGTACGIDLKTDTQDGVALSFNVFDSYPAVRVSNPNENPICHAQIKVFLPSTGKSITVPVVDKCGDCKDADVDFSKKSYLALGLDFAQGRVPGVEWEFVGGTGPVDSASPANAAVVSDTETGEESATTTLLPVGNAGAVTEVDDGATATVDGADAVETVDGADAVETVDGADAVETNRDDDVKPTLTDDSPLPTGSTSGGAGGSCIDAWNSCNLAFTGTVRALANYKCHTDYAACSGAEFLNSKRMNNKRTTSS